MSYKITKVFKRNARTGDIVAIYPSPKVAGEAEGVTPDAIVQRCRERTIIRGYYFEGKKERMHRETKCWRCANACGGCSWSRDFVPVPGWDADRHDLNVSEKDDTRRVESYHVKRCPEFVPDRPRKMQFAWMEQKCVECGSLLLCAACGPICKKRSKT